MSADWPVVTLEDVTSKLGDGLHGTPEYDESGEYYFINGNNLGNGKITIDAKTKRASEKEFLKHKKDLNDRTILVSINGTIGNIGLYNGEKVFLGKSACYFNVKEGVDKQFIRYVVTSNYFQNHISSLASGSTIKNVSLKLMREFTFRLPPLVIQSKISKILVDIDDKIELNRQTNQTLEHIAQAIFKSWFVDFEPTRAKIAAKQRWQALHEIVETSSPTCYSEAEDTAKPNIQDLDEAMNQAAMTAISGKTPEELQRLSPEQLQHLQSIAALFPDALVDSELGEIPEEWEVKCFGDVSKCFDSKRIPLSKKQREEKKPGDIPYYGATSIMDYVNEWLFDDIYLLLGEDGSVMKADGTPFIQYIWGKSWVNNHAHVLQGKNGVSTEQLMLFFQSQNIAAYITGAVQLKLNQGNMNSIPFLDGGVALNTSFFNFIAPLYEKIRGTVGQTKSLEQLRNSLLPKLLSGELSTTPTQTELEKTA